MRHVLVSACLAGVHSRYDGACNFNKALIQRLELEGCVIVPVCPEQLGGLPTPRSPAEIVGGEGRDVLEGNAGLINEDGENVTENYIRGAQEVARLARMLGVKRAYLKSKSPACGVDGIKRSGRIVGGMGVCAERLVRMGVEVVEVD